MKIRALFAVCCVFYFAGGENVADLGADSKGSSNKENGPDSRNKERVPRPEDLTVKPGAGKVIGPGTGMSDKDKLKAMSILLEACERSNKHSSKHHVNVKNTDFGKCKFTCVFEPGMDAVAEFMNMPKDTPCGPDDLVSVYFFCSYY